MAEKTIEQLTAELAEAQLKASNLEGKVADQATALADLQASNGALVQQNKTLQNGVGLAGSTSGLPQSVLDDIQRRIDLGATERHATEKAFEQHKHDLRRAALAKAKTEASAPVAPSNKEDGKGAGKGKA